MSIGPQAIATFLERLNENAAASEQALNAADARLGDGDTGSMLRRVMAAMAHAGAGGAETASDAAKRAAAAAMKETGSSLGSLVATAAMTLARKAKEIEASGRTPETADLPMIVEAIRDAISARGKASVGDKTVVDSFDYLTRYFAQGPVSLETAQRAANDALDQMRPMPCRIGRARMFAERSIGSDDPGMLAVAKLLG